MFSIFDYLRRLVRDSVLAGVQDAFEIMDQGDHREAIGIAARDFLNRGVPELPSPVASGAAKPSAAPQATGPASLPAASIAELLPSSITLPAQVPPQVQGYDKFERRKRGPGRPQQSQPPQGPSR